MDYILGFIHGTFVTLAVFLLILALSPSDRSRIKSVLEDVEVKPMERARKMFRKKVKFFSPSAKEAQKQFLEKIKEEKNI